MLALRPVEQASRASCHSSEDESKALTRKFPFSKALEKLMLTIRSNIDTGVCVARVVELIHAQRRTTKILRGMYAFLS